MAANDLYEVERKRTSRRCWRRFASCVMLLLVVFGCSDAGEKEAARIVVRGGDGQCGYQGEMLGEPLKVEVLGPKRPGGWGGTRERPAANVKVRVEALRGKGSTASAKPQEGVTDAAGIFSCNLTLGEEFGDQYFRVTCPDFPHAEMALIHAVSGVKIENGGQEVMAGNSLPQPIVVTVKERKTPGSELKPVSGVPLYVRQVDGGTAKLAQSQALTDKNGEVKLDMTTASGFTGMCNFIVELGDGYRYSDSGMTEATMEPHYRSRGMKISVLVLSRWGIIIGVLGGLGIFIFGMSMMSNGLQQIAGERLKTLLQLFAGTRFKAVMAGLVVTSLIQSSGATTVMVVGFVNAQLLNLMQSVGIIYGAAIGTTVTAQMVSFKLDGLALPTICVGVVTLMLATKSHWRGIGNTLLGFGLLFYGMMMMSRELSALAEFPGFMAFFQMFDCSPKGGSMPFLNIIGAIVVGTILTVVVQSSSATVGMTIALAEAGLLNFYTAMPLILGDNIGSTITGHLAALGAGRKAKQVAMAATIFKMCAVIIAVPLFYVSWNGHPCFMELINQMTAGDVFNAHNENIGRHLANAHTIFNLITVAAFIPLTGLVVRLTLMLMPDKKDGTDVEPRLCFLESHLLNTPSAALSQVVNALVTMAGEAIRLTQDATSAFLAADSSVEAALRKQENRIDEAQKDIIDYLVKLTRRNLTENQSSTIPVFMHCVNDVERIGDRAINIFELIKQMPTVENGMIDAQGASADEIARESKLSELAVSEITEICSLITRMADQLLQGMASNDPEAFTKVIKRDAEVKALTSRFERNHENRLKNQDCTVQKGIVFVEILANMERISAHLTNLAERARDMSQHRITF